MNVSELKELFESCDVDADIVEGMFADYEEINEDSKGEIFLPSPFAIKEGRKEKTPSCHINLRDLIWYDHSSSAPENKRGGHIYTLIVMLGGMHPEYVEDTDLIIRYAETIMSKGRHIDSIMESLATKKPNWTRKDLLRNRSVGYDEGTHALLFFTFELASRNSRGFQFSLTRHAHAYPLVGGIKEWVDVLEKGRKHDAFQEKVLFVSHDDLRLDSSTRNFHLEISDVSAIAFCEGEPDAISLSQLGGNRSKILGTSWKNYAAFPSMEKVPCLVFSDIGAEKAAKNFAIRLSGGFKDILFYSFKKELLAKIGLNVEVYASTSSDEFSSEIQEAEGQGLTYYLGHNYDITDFINQFPAALPDYLENCGELIQDTTLGVPVYTLLPMNDDDHAQKIRHRIMSRIENVANLGKLPSFSDKGHAQYQKVGGGLSQITSAAHKFRGYVVTQNIPYTLWELVFPCTKIDEKLCGECSIYKNRAALADVDSAISSRWLSADEHIPVKFRILPGTHFDAYPIQQTVGSRQKFLAGLGTTCGYAEEPTPIHVHSFDVICDDTDNLIRCVPISSYISERIERRKFMEYLEFSGYYYENVFIVTGVHSPSESPQFNIAGTRIGRSRYIKTIKSLMDGGKNKSPDEIWETLNEVIDILEIAIGTPGFMDKNHLFCMFVSILSSCYISRNITEPVPLSEATAKHVISGYYMGHSLFVLGQVSSGKTAVIKRFATLFGSSVRAKDFGSALKSLFVPSATALTDKNNASFLLAECAGGMVALDGLQARNLSAQRDFAFEWLDSPLETGLTSPHGVMAAQVYGSGSILCPTPLVFSGNFEDEGKCTDMDVMLSYTRFASTIRGNVDALQKRIAPIKALKQKIKYVGESNQVILGESPETLAKLRADAEFIIRSLKSFQLQHAVIPGDNDEILSFAISRVPSTFTTSTNREVVARRGISLANTFRVLRLESFMRKEDIRYAIKKITSDSVKVFHYSDLQNGTDFTNTAVAKFPPQSLFKDYVPFGSQFHSFVKTQSKEWLQFHLSQWFTKSRGKSEIVFNLRGFAEDCDLGTDSVIKFLNLDPQEKNPITKITSANLPSRVSVPEAFWDGMKLLSGEK